MFVLYKTESDTIQQAQDTVKAEKEALVKARKVAVEKEASEKKVRIIV